MPTSMGRVIFFIRFLLIGFCWCENGKGKLIDEMYWIHLRTQCRRNWNHRRGMIEWIEEISCRLKLSYFPYFFCDKPRRKEKKIMINFYYFFLFQSFAYSFEWQQKKKLSVSKAQRSPHWIQRALSKPTVAMINGHL